MKKIFVAALVVSAATAAPAHAGPTVTVRVEGEHATLLERTTVTLPDGDVIACGDGGNWTVADAIEVATGGNWDRQQFVQTILGESHTFTRNDYWAEWLDAGSGYRYGNGICSDVMKNGDEALMLVDLFGSAPTAFPLDLEGVPSAIEVGRPVTVTVVAYVTADGTPGTGTRTPVTGATVAGGGVSAVTGADGKATLSFAEPGAFAVKASKPGSVVSAGERVTVSAVPVPPAAAPPSAVPGTVTTPADETAPRASFARLTNGKVYKRKRAPRKLSGSVSPDPSGLLSVRLSILREVGDRCWAFDGASERFERHRCGGRRSFRIGDRAEWSYLLPKRLGKGRYVIRAVAIDNAGNDSAEQVVIRVR